MNQVYLSLGSNRGKRQEYLQKAVELLTDKVGKVTKASSLYETQPWKMKDNTNFLNQVILLESIMDAQEIMDIIIQIEISMGRVREKAGYEPRTIDIDILFLNDSVIKTQSLTIPHPFIQERRFVLEPLNEIAPDYIHPVFGKSVKQLLSECPDMHSITRFVSK